MARGRTKKGIRRYSRALAGTRGFKRRASRINGALNRANRRGFIAGLKKSRR